MFSFETGRQDMRWRQHRPHRSWLWKTDGLLSPLLLATLLAMPSLAHAQILEGRAVPRQTYFLAFQPFNQGDYRDALKAFRSAANSGINTGAGRWVDSICYFTMMGECLYHLGDLGAALEQYDAALQLRIEHERLGWLKRVQLVPPVIGPAAATARITWGPSIRNPVPGAFPDTMHSMQGTDINVVLQQGGVVAPNQLYPVRVIEIMRCTALALKRRREILGPLAPQLPLTHEIVKELSSVKLPANHWLRTLIDVQLAIAKAGAGETDDALALLQSSLVVSGRYDHPLTALALLEIGQIASEKNDLSLAQQSFFEASFPAAYFRQADAFVQADALEEALTSAARIHTFKSEPGIFAPLATATESCRVENLDRAAAAMLLVAAEQSTIMGDAKQAVRLLSQAQQAMGRSDLRNADLGVQLLYQNAQLAFETGDAAAGIKVLGEAVRLHKVRSKRLFQLDLTNRLYSSKELSSRVADLMLTELLREPTAQDWQQNRFETLLLEVTPHLPLLGRWLEVTLDRSAGGNLEELVLVSEMVRRHKFFSQLPMGGRLLALGWVLEAPEVLLNDETRTQRQNLLNKYTEVAARSRQIEQLKAELIQLPVVPATAEETKTYERVARELAQAADDQESMLLRLAMRPDPAARMFPPLMSLDEIQQHLTEGQAILAFVADGRNLHALLLTPDKQSKTWMLSSPAKMRSDLTSLMREIGNYDQKQVLLAERLTSQSWKDLAASLFAPIEEQLPAETLASFKELIVVPDDFLWYVPFEMLQVNVGSERKALIDLVPIRYAPTIALAVGDARPKQSSGPRVIVQGRLFSRETGDMLTATAEQLKQQESNSIILSRRLPYGTRYLASVWQQLVVLDDVEGIEKDALNWSPAQIDQGKPGGALTDWLQLPWGAPDVVVLPGYHTPAEDGMRGQHTGDELLISSCGLMAAGARTLLLSRWRTGGRTSMELIREFLQELPQQSASTAWQRSVLLVRSGELDPSDEPRLKNVKPEEVPSADHPFFWAGHLLMGAW
jgi:CHAT domain-containing protein